MSANDLVLDVTGVTLAIDLPSPEWQVALRRRYAAFLGADPATWQVELRERPELAGGSEFWIHHEGSTSTFRAGAYHGTIDLAQRRAAISTPSEERSASAVERISAYICMLDLPARHSGLLLHGAAIVWQGQGHAFCGASGSGKSTLAALASGHAETLVDENLVVRRAGSGFDLLSTPFWGDEHTTGAHPAGEPQRPLASAVPAPPRAPIHNASPEPGACGSLAAVDREGPGGSARKLRRVARGRGRPGGASARLRAGLSPLRRDLGIPHRRPLGITPPLKMTPAASHDMPGARPQL